MTKTYEQQKKENIIIGLGQTITTLNTCLDSLDNLDKIKLLEFIQKQLNQKTNDLRENYLQIENIPF